MAKGGVLPRGAMLGGYRLGEPLGQGGMGVVYAALEVRTGRAVALKLIARELAADEGFLARFRREARAGAAVRHPNVVALLDAGEADGSPFLVFEHVPGGSLQEALRARGALPWREAAALGAGIARGLAAIHAAGLVHRDLKPANVLLGESGKPKISDLGLVGAHAASLAVSRALTKTGELLGTLEFMAPEQADGSRVVTAKADLYALGALLWTTVAGRPPFEGTGYALVKKHLLEKAPRPSELASGLDPAFERLTLRLLEKDPARRPESANDVASALEALAGPESAGRARRSPSVGVLVAAAVVLAAAGVAAFLALGETAAEQASRLALHAESLDRERRHDEAVLEASRALALDPRNARALRCRGAIRLARGELDAALADLSLSIEVEPESVSTLAARATAHGKKRELDAALADLVRATALDPSHRNSWELRGVIHTDRREWAKARECFTRAIELDPLAVSYANRGVVRHHERDLKGAVEDLTRAIELDPRCVQAYEARADARLGRGEREAARLDAEKALELDPKRALTHCILGELHGLADDLPRSIAELTRAIELDPKLARAFMARGTSYNNAKDLDRAESDLSEAIRLDPREFHAWASRGAVRISKESWEDGLADLTRALELAPDDAGTRLDRGVARQLNGDRHGAIQDLEKYLELAPPGDPGRADARARLEKLRSP